MFLALIGVAQVGMGIDLHDADGFAQCTGHAHNRAIAERVFAAQRDRHLARADGGLGALGQPFHDIRQRTGAIQRRFGEDAIDARFGMAGDAFEFIAGCDDRGGAACRARAV